MSGDDGCRRGRCGTSSLDASEHQLPDNCVEYFLFLLESGCSARKQLLELEALQKTARDLAQALAKDYIWQRDGFEPEMETANGVQYLHGTAEYGDAVEDEWLIVYMLRELSKSHPNLWVRVVDTDGEFLLIEAANVLPEWLSPGMDRNRVWIHDGRLFLVPLEEDQTGETRNRSLSLSQALQFLQSKPDCLVHSPFIQTEAFYRLEKYPGKIAESAHNSLVTIPRRLAHVIHSLPKCISPAVEAFYLRDSLSLRPIMSVSAVLAFPPEDLVTTSVRFSRVLFAQLKSQRFEPPPRWHRLLQEASSSNCADLQKKIGRLESGMKLTCGFELLAASPAEGMGSDKKRRATEEMTSLLEKMAKFGAAALPTDCEMALWQDCHRDDDENWMDIDYRDFERELDGKPASERNTGFGDAQTQADLRKIVSRFEAFLNDESAGLDGAELDPGVEGHHNDDGDDGDDDGDDDDDSEFEDKAVSFDEQAFSRMMREMMGLPSLESQTATEAQANVAGTQDEESAQIQELAQQMEAELKHHGALTSDAPLDNQAVLTGEEQAIKPPSGHSPADLAQESMTQDEHGEVDVDFNLASNILKSFKSQAGMAGPTGNLLGLMGIRLPRDEDEAVDKKAQQEL